MALEIVTKIQLIRYISRIIKAQCFKAVFVQYDIGKYFFHIIIKLDYKHLTYKQKKIMNFISSSNVKHLL